MALGIEANGWDPVHRSDGELREADVVNIGYVANVIEDSKERSETLQDAWRVAKKKLIVTARLLVEAKNKKYGVYNGTDT
jgi:DNA phosphorothioation-associated putative methyltransferase